MPRGRKCGTCLPGHSELFYLPGICLVTAFLEVNLVKTLIFRQKFICPVFASFMSDAALAHVAESRIAPTVAQ